MPTFTGFPDGKTPPAAIPAAFFTELLPEINDLAELKVTLYLFWYLNQQQGRIRYITEQDFRSDRRLMDGLGPNETAALSALQDGLERAVQRRTMIKMKSPEKMLYFLNSQRGRAAARALQAGEWSPDQIQRAPVSLEVERPNLYQLYEENIGPLTPLIADNLRDAEAAYPNNWIEEAIRIAVEKNARNWRYIQAILDSWQKEGRDGTNRQDLKSDWQRYVGGEFADFIEH